MIRKLRVIVFTTTTAIIAFAGPAFAAGEHGGDHDDGGHGHQSEHSFDFGAPADPSEADRTITVIAEDTMRFSPESVAVKAGETVRFVIENTGKLQHAFALGTPEGQQEHEESMQGMAAEMIAGHMKDDLTGVVVQPGETGELTWRFNADGPVEFACHVPGHYPAGMKGRISIE